MSYSFQVKAASKVEAAKKVEEQLDLVVQSQPVHAADRQAAQDAAHAFINLLAEPAEGQLVAVNVQGYRELAR
jgi:altronate dehydratase